ncbi:MAG: hypothetical protein WKF40_07515 [Thermoleophilaceae bacterium]
MSRLMAIDEPPTEIVDTPEQAAEVEQPPLIVREPLDGLHGRARAGRRARSRPSGSARATPT